MKRIFISRKVFYAVRRISKRGIYDIKDIAIDFKISRTTITRILKSHNFKEYKELGSIYGKGVKSLRKRYLFILGVIAVVLLILNLK